LKSTAANARPPTIFSPLRATPPEWIVMALGSSQPPSIVGRPLPAATSLTPGFSISSDSR
jgi:hypothetical protein